MTRVQGFLKSVPSEMKAQVILVAVTKAELPIEQLIVGSVGIMSVFIANAGGTLNSIFPSASLFISDYVLERFKTCENTIILFYSSSRHYLCLGFK